MPVTAKGQGSNILSPDLIGVVFVITRQDSAQIGGLGAGPSVVFFIGYDISYKHFISIGAGYLTVTDDYLKMKNFKAVLVPSVELKFGYRLFIGQKLMPFVYTGIHFFGSESKYISVPEGSTVESRYNLGGIWGAGVEYRSVYKWSLYLSWDYRYTFTSSSTTKTQYWLMEAGLTFHLHRMDDIYDYIIETFYSSTCQ